MRNIREQNTPTATLVRMKSRKVQFITKRLPTLQDRADIRPKENISQIAAQQIEALEESSSGDLDWMLGESSWSIVGSVREG